jgi:phosphatidylserine decarboxylase
MKIAKQGWPFVIGCFIAGSMFLELGQILKAVWPAWVAGFGFLAAFYCAFFFRDPRRVIPQGDRLILCPADGKIVEVAETNGTWLVRIFLSVFDPHIQRVPQACTIKSIRYTEGKFLDARHPQAHFENEQNRLELMSGPVSITVIQIAGLIARRIVCWVKEGQTLAAGEQFGLIRFGSQVDMTFSGPADVKIKVGDRVKAGETIVAERR